MTDQPSVAEAPNIWAVAQQQFDQAADKLSLDPDCAASCASPSAS